MSLDAEPSRPGRQLLRFVGGLLLAALVVGLVVSSLVFVDETEFAFVERFGHLVAVYDRPEDRGLHVKLPWPIDLVRRFDRRLQIYDPPGREVFTRDKKNLTVDSYICWRIAEPTDTHESLLDRPVVRFFRSLGSLSIAEARLDSRVHSVLTTTIGRVELSDLINARDSESGPADGRSPLTAITDTVREQLTQRPREGESLRDRLGIEIVDVRIKRINLPSGNQQAVFERMKSERRKIADRYRSAGMAENRVIRSQADRQYGELLAKADAEAERIRGSGEAEALRILNKAHAQDPEFYRVLQTLDTYRTIFNDKTTLVLSASSGLLKLLTEGVPTLSEEPPPVPSFTPTEPKPANAVSAAADGSKQPATRNTP